MLYKTEFINNEIERALKEAPSKARGKGNNYPAIKLFLKTKDYKLNILCKIKILLEKNIAGR